MRQNIIKIFVIISLFAIIIVIMTTGKKENTRKQAITTEKQTVDSIKNNWKSDVEAAKQGKYPNLNVISMEFVPDDIALLEQIDLVVNKDYEKRTSKENLEHIEETIKNFYGDQFDLSVVNVNYMNQSGEYESLPYEDFKSQVDVLKPEPYFLLFGDARENGGKGFLQIDSSNTQIWFSRGEIQATLPMYRYDTKKIYNLAISKSGLRDKVLLADGEIAIADAIDFVEDYLNHHLPYKKNDDFTYEVVEVRQLDVDGKDALGFCVRKSYQQISFDYIDGITDNQFNSDYFDDRGEVCMIKCGEIDNLCGLGGDIYSVEKTSEPLTKILSLADALSAVSSSIGDNSVYDVYGVELIYQFKEQQEKERYQGRLVWKIISRNQNDDKDTWFYVDVETGEVNYRYKQIFGQ